MRKIRKSPTGSVIMKIEGFFFSPQFHMRISTVPFKKEHNFIVKALGSECTIGEKSAMYEYTHHVSGGR